jgi:hypothetical protein
MEKPHFSYGKRMLVTVTEIARKKFGVGVGVAIGVGF